MKNYNKYFLLTLAASSIICVSGVNGQVKTFAATFGTANNDIGNFVQQTMDGGYIICGAKGDPGTIGYYDYSLTKINCYGAIQWTSVIGDSAYDEQAQCVRQMSDGSYIVYGSRSGSTNSTAWLVKTDENGNKQWATEQQGSQTARYGYSVLVAPDGGFQTASYDNGTGDTDYFELLKTDATGNPQWGPKNIVKGVGGNSSLALTNDGNFVTVGTTQVIYDAPSGNYLSSIVLVKTSAAGAVLWSKSYTANIGNGNSNYLQGFGVEATKDGGYIICGCTTVNTKGGTDIFLLKTDGSGDSLWSKSYGGIMNEVATSVKEIPGGGYALTGNTKSFGSGSTDIFILRTSATGDSLWMHTFGGAAAETAGNIEVTSDSGFVVTGTTNSFGAGQSDIFVLRTDSLGRIPDNKVMVSGNNNICSGSSVTLMATAGYAYSWSTGATTQSITVSQTGNYSVTVKDNYNNSNVSKTIAINVNHPIATASFTAGGSTSFCAGNSVMLTADSAAGYIYQWQANGADINGANARRYTASEDGVYNVVISNACNTATSTSVTTNVLPLPQVPTISIVGKNLVSSSNVNNQWYKNGTLIPNATNATYTPVQDGTYTVVVGNANNCTATSQPLTLNTVGIKEINNTASYLLYPNPAADYIYVDYNVTTAGTNYFVMYSTDGKEAYRERLENSSGLIKIDTYKLASGLYFSGIDAQGAFEGRKTIAVIHR